MKTYKSKCQIKDTNELVNFWQGKTRKYPIHNVQEIIEKVHLNGLNPTVKEYNISKSTIRTWMGKEKNAIGVLKAYYKRKNK